MDMPFSLRDETFRLKGSNLTGISTVLVTPVLRAELLSSVSWNSVALVYGLFYIPKAALSRVMTMPSVLQA